MTTPLATLRRSLASLLPRRLATMVFPLARPTTQVWKLAHAPAAAVDDDTFVLAREPLPPLAPGDVLLQTLYLSNDPAQRTYIQPGVPAERAYAPPVAVGQVMNAYGIGKVLDSRSPKFTVGALAIGSMGWREYAVLPDAALRPAPVLPGLSPTLALGALGGPALTAWFGLTDVCKIGPGSTVLISGAAGATGSAAVQIAKKMLGAARVVGIAGGAAKCAWVRDTLGADACVDYKAPGFRAALAAATPGFVDAYLDLVGGEMLNAALTRVKRHGLIGACGSISTYNDPARAHLTNWHEIIESRLSVRGYIVLDYAAQWPAARARLERAVRAGVLVVAGAETLRAVPFAAVPRVWRGLFAGENRGKLVTQIVPAPGSAPVLAVRSEGAACEGAVCEGATP